MGEYLDIGSNTDISGYVVVLIAAALAYAIFNVFFEDQGNDDDDSDSGNGGLMQPVA